MSGVLSVWFPRSTTRMSWGAGVNSTCPRSSLVRAQTQIVSCLFCGEEGVRGCVIGMQSTSK